jgi:hypothetical protein
MSLTTIRDARDYLSASSGSGGGGGVVARLHPVLQERAQLLGECRALVDRAESEARDFNRDEPRAWSHKLARIEQLDAKLADEAKASPDPRLAQFDAPIVDEHTGELIRRPSRSFGFDPQEFREALKEVKAGHPARLQTVVDAPGAPFSDVADFRRELVSPALRDQTRVANLLPTSSTSGPTVVVYRTSQLADQAAVVPAGQSKPTSDPEWEEVVVPSSRSHTCASSTTLFSTTSSAPDRSSSRSCSLA